MLSLERFFSLKMMTILKSSERTTNTFEHPTVEEKKNFKGQKCKVSESEMVCKKKEQRERERERRSISGPSYVGCAFSFS